MSSDSVDSTFEKDQVEPKLSRAQRRQKARDGKKLSRCFICGAQMYPRVIVNPKNKAEREAVFCPSCGNNLTEMAAAMKEFEQKMAEEAERRKLEKEAKESASESTEPVDSTEHEPSVQV